MSMLWTASGLTGYTIRATDSSIGSIADLLFDDREWTIRWAVVDTGTWLPGRQVLLPPSSFGQPDPVGQEFPVRLTREQVKDSPGVDTDAPVSRQMETDLYTYYGWTPYWYAYPGYVPPVGGAAGPVPPAGAGYPRAGRARISPDGEPTADPDLRSVGEVTGYYVHATDGDIGHIEEFLIDDAEWAVRYLVVDTRNWWPGKKVLLAPDWISDVSWGEQRVQVELTRDQVKGSPEYDPTAPVDREYEVRLYGYYGYPPYWA